MGISAAPGMTSEEIVSLSRAHTLFSWSVQGALDPIAIDHAEGVYLYTPEGRRILDFNSQLMSVNIGHGNPRVIAAITEQATKLQFVQPAFATEIRARLGAKLAEILPGDMNKVFFTLGGAEAVENAIKLARHVTGKHKLLARYRAYHGATAGAMTLTGDYRRWANEPGIVGVVRYPDTHRWGEKEPRSADEALNGLEDVIKYEGAQTIAAIFLETVVGTNGILIPPDGYLKGVRELCDKYGIMMVADEVMAGFGRTGRWFAVDHWDVVPDLMTMAKGLTSQLPAAGRGRDARPHLRGDGLEDVLRRPHLQQPPRQPRRRPGHDRGLRGRRPHRQRRPHGRGDAPAPRGPGGAAPVAWAPTATSACSGSWTSSAARTRGRRSRRSTGPATR